MYVDFVYWHLILVTPDGHTFVCAVLPIILQYVTAEWKQS